MKLKQVVLACMPWALCCAGSVALAVRPAKQVIYDIPRLENITIDGNGQDWGTRGFRVNAMHDISEALHDSPRTTQSDVTMRMGWDARGLLLLINVIDVSPQEDDNIGSLWRKDCIELYMTDQLGGKNYFQLLLAPGVDGRHAEIRQFFYDHRSAEALKAVPLACTAARNKTANGYLLEALLPWTNLAVTPALGHEVGVQVMVNDYDPQGALWHKLWYPQPGAAFFSDRMYPVRLAETPSAPVQLQAYCYQERFHRIVVSAIGVAEQAGKQLTVHEGHRLLGRARMIAAGNGRSMAEVLLPLPANGPHYAVLTADIDGKQFTLDPVPIYLARQRAILRLAINGSSSVFSGTGFPNVEFTDPALAENLLGRYTLRTSYFNAVYQPVSSAETPGRYGALVEVTTEYGVMFRRYVTLFRLPATAKWGEQGLPVTQGLLTAFGQDADVTREQAPALDRVRDHVYGGFTRLPESAVTLAGLAEIKPGDGSMTDRTSLESRDANWWYGLRQRLGITETYPYVVLYPTGYGRDNTTRYPLIIFLHGSGNPDFSLELFKHNPVDKGLVEFARTKYPAIIVAPCSQLGGWSPQLVDALRAEMLVKEPVDPDRVYLTGLSMGGFGAWRTAAAFPDHFAAVVPIAGGGDTHDAVQLKDLPIWAFHGAEDDVVNVAFSQDMVKAITDAGGHPKLTLYPGVGHGSWGPAYADAALYDWLFQQRRGTTGAR